MKKWKQRIALFLSVILSITSVFTWNSTIRVHAEEAVIKSSADGFEYRYQSDTHEYLCTSDKTQVYDDYKDAIKGLADISRKILVERKVEPFIVKIPVEIKADQKVADIENASNPFNDAVQKETYKETGNPDEGQGLAQFLYARGNLMNDKLDKITYDESSKSYKGVFYYHTLSHKYSERYSQTITKLKEIMDSLNLDGKSDYEKCIAIRKWIAKNVKYDDEFFKNAESCPRKNAHDMTGAVLDGYAVCDGYAYLFHYMANAAGLLTLVEHGVLKGSGNHAWNLVQIDGTFYYTDCTGGISLDKNGEPTAEFLYGQDYMFNLDVTPKNNDIENTYSNISKDDWLKDHSVCKGKHNLVENGGRYPTCEAMGTTEYHCTNTGCNYIERIYTDPPKGHNYDYTNGEIIQSQDCTHPEITRYRCTRCKDPKDVETKPSLGGHKWKAGDITKEPTCTVNGEQQYTCTVCNQTKTEPVKATGHDWQINKILSAATCTSNGIARYICKTCGYGENHTITATGHKPEIRNKKEATCSSTGYTGDTYCSVCNKKLSSGETIAKKEHTWVKQDNIPATCEKGGMEVEKCSVCGETKETQISDPLGHDYGEWKVTKEPTCTKYGTKKRICKRCNEYEIDVIDPTGHQHTKIIDQKKATCEEKGYSGDLYCEDCRLIIQLGHDIAATGHTWDDGEITKEPTQTATGIKTYTCKTCHKTRTETIPMLKGHHWDDGTVIKEPTCTESGEKIYHCTDEDCNESYTEIIKATGHQHTKLIRKKEAACEEEGYSGDTYCEDCKQIIKAGKTISPTGHINTEIRNKRTATCESEGYTGDTYCITCNKKLKDGQTIPKTDHNWTIKEIPATCESDGSRTYICDTCKETKVQSIKATGHTYGAWITTQSATVFNPEQQKRTCGKCGKEEYRTNGNNLTPTIRTNAASLKFKKKQSTSKFKITGLAKGDYIKSFTSSNKKLITITGNKTGTCKIKAANKTGKTKITITLASGLKKTITVTIQKKAITATAIKNVQKNITLNKKQTYQLKPMIEPITYVGKAKYKSSNKKIAKVSSTGKITAIKPGKVKITISVGKKKFVSNVIIKK
ncbi:Ig-like domain-containing protein [Anaerostipes hadrus]|uniref:Ig-like domain-containing protein n=1 Tax=Anaerostipes hadrus TaxID=649756 RepID=UPI001D07F534|nr:Ig-like domain-containing protein [Anaerostipes hadrus]MCB6170026.1 Ig-like domain-containing protein [Anaerostipes hadrus]MCB6653824.1 Ig-like domain-containing protein [Anaerostipes hadrus]MCB6655232.1 Ig-like domain-containing protein [Anaerostipes hadrus]MCB6680367.1 Ig-like domain-containing protein [Anaerostipes hadrus]MCB6743657.1 Ig-like domain-containing protein [Anaerostipes hadrus]